MKPTAFKPDLAALEAQREALLQDGASLEAVTATAIQSLAENILKRPASHLLYGPYWFAAKQVFQDGGIDFGSDTDPVMVRDYGVWDGNRLDPLLTLLAAETFKAHYRATYFADTREFELFDDGETWELRDTDMDALPEAI